MKQNNLKLTPKTIIACILLVISLILLFTPWLQMSVKLNGKQYTFKKMINTFGAMEGVSESEIKSEVYDGIEELADDLSDFGMNLNTRKVMHLFEVIYSGKLSVLDVARFGGTISGLLRQLHNSGLDSYILGGPLGELSDAYVQCLIGTVIYWLLFAAAIVLFVLALIGLLQGKKKSVMPYAIVVLVLLAVFLIGNFAGNRALSSSGMLEDVFDELSYYDLYPNNYRIVHLRAAAFFCVIFAWLAYAVTQSNLDFGASKLANSTVGGAPVVFPAGKQWNCAVCGTAVAAEARFCSNCGAKRPEARFCPNCGAKLADGQRFCGECGSSAG